MRWGPPELAEETGLAVKGGGSGGAGTVKWDQLVPPSLVTSKLSGRLEKGRHKPNPPQPQQLQRARPV